MKQKKSLQPGDVDNPGKPQKLKYATPVLRVYGSVSRLTRGGTGTVADITMTAMAMSDRSCKENITRVGDHHCGFGLYLFDYIPQYKDQWGHGRQFGVMADEVEVVMPDAVSVYPDGYKRVNYAMLGITRPS